MQVSSGHKLLTRVVISVQLAINLTEITYDHSYIFWLLLKVRKADPGWQLT